MRVFVLDDEIYLHRRPILAALVGHSLTIATDIFMAQRVYDGPYDLILLDHDMHGIYQSPDDEDTGAQFVKWLVKHEEGATGPKPTIILHSQNTEGRRAMNSILALGGLFASEFPFGNLYVKCLRDTYGKTDRTKD